MTEQIIEIKSTPSVKDDLEKALKAFSFKKSHYDEYWRYYLGNHEIKYSTERIRAVFGKLDVLFIENWCQVAIDSPKDRLDIRGYSSEDKAIEKLLSEIWDDEDLALEASSVHENALITGEAFLIAYGEGEELWISSNDSRFTHVFYDEENPKEKKFAAKIWVDEDGTHVMLYYTDRFEEWLAPPKKAKGSETLIAEKTSNKFELIDTEENPLKWIPVIHFRTNKNRPMSLLHNLLPIQDAINKLFSDMMVTSEFSAFPQRYAVTNADPGNEKLNPYDMMLLPKGARDEEGTQVGQFPPSQIDKFQEVIDREARTMAYLSRVPRHFFSQTGSSQSGDALVAAEAPLNAMVRDLIKNFTPGWKELAWILLEIRKQSQERVHPRYLSPETKLPRVTAEVRKINRDAGLPLVTILREEGWSPEEIAQLQKDQEEEDKKKTVDLATQMRNAERLFNRSGSEGEEIESTEGNEE